MEKTIISYNENGITIEVTQIKQEEHRQARNEAEQLGFSFDTIDADSFIASTSKENRRILSQLEDVGYSF